MINDNFKETTPDGVALREPPFFERRFKETTPDGVALREPPFFERRFKVDVVIPTFHPDGRFTRLMRGLLRQDYPIGNIYVINTGSPLPAGMVFYPEVPTGTGITKIHVTNISEKEFDHAGTRQWAAEKSDADFLLYMTQDAVPVNDRVVSELLAAFDDQQVDVSYARQIPDRNCRTAERVARRHNYPSDSRKKTAEDLETMGIKAFFCSDVCAMYRKETFQKLGGFPKSANFNEDMIYAHKVLTNGGAVYYQARAKVIHSHNYSAKQYFSRNFELGMSHTMFRDVFAKYPAEGSGIGLVKHQALALLEAEEYFGIPGLVFVSACKYAGYRLGKMYRILPKELIGMISRQALEYINKES